MKMNRRGLFGFIAGALAFAASPVAMASTRKNTPLQDANTRLIISEIKRYIENMSNYALFQPNDAFTRYQLNSALSQYMASMKSRNVIADYEVVVDETNNTPKIIENNELVMDVYVKPRKTISYLRIRSQITRDSLEISSNN